MIKTIISTVIGGVMTVIIIEMGRHWGIPWYKNKFKVNVDLRGTWSASWEWENPTGEAKDEIQIEKQSGNDVSGRRIFFDEPKSVYKLRGFYKDGLLVAYYWSADPGTRHGGVMVLCLEHRGNALTGKVMYPEHGNLGRLIASNINTYEREGSR